MERYDAGDRVSVDESGSGVEVELTRDGKVMARVVPMSEPSPAFDGLAALEALHASLPPAVFDVDWQAILREVREGRPRSTPKPRSMG